MITWTYRAANELNNILNNRSSASAAKFADAVMNRVDLLKRFPERGRLIPEKSNPMYRELLYKSYRIIYRLDREADLFTILRYRLISIVIPREK